MMESEISEKTLEIASLPEKLEEEHSSDLDRETNRPSSSSSLPEGTDWCGVMGAGLVNLGNTCFLNAVLQCFTHTVPLVESLRAFDHQTPCFRGGVEGGFCVVCTLREHVELSLTLSGGIFSPHKFVDNLSYLNSSFQKYEQEDAHEFLQCLLDRLDTSCSDMGCKDQNMSLQEDGFVKKIFGGCLKSQLQCCNCGHCSNTFEPLIDLSLEIEDDTLSDALKSFTKNEKIEETKFRCEGCKEDVFVEKKLTLAQTPLVAAFHLKRFKNDGSFVEKIDKHVKYPLVLDLQPYTSDREYDNVQVKYELYAVVVHIGLSSNSGHYFCFIRSAPQTWHMFDDSKVRRVSEEFVLSQEAYILFYIKQGSPWFASIMEARNKCRELTSSPKSVLDNIENTHTPFPIGERVSSEAVEAHDDAEEIPVAIPLDYCSSKSLNTRHVSPPTTPTRSPSPDIYAEEPPEVSYSIPRDHLREKQNLKRPADKVLEDSERKEAFRLTRSMPQSRAMKLRACLLGSHSETSADRKRQKMRYPCDVGVNRRQLSYGYL